MEKKAALELFSHADSMFRQGRYDRSLDDLRHLEQCFPNNRTLLYAMALCLERLDKRDEAVGLCNQLVREHHYDKAIILKARLITTPSDPPPGSHSSHVPVEDRLAWPSYADVFAAPPSAVKPVAPALVSPLWRVCAVGIMALAALVLLPLLVVVFAQAEVSVPGALPTLYPGRVLFLSICVFAVATMVFLWCEAQMDAFVKRSGSLRIFIAAVSVAGCSVFPVIGWVAMLLGMCKGLGFSATKSIGILVFIVAMQMASFFVMAYSLGVADVWSIYLELKAGYG